MKKENQTMVTFLIIKGISENLKVKVTIFIVVLLMYLITLGGNMVIILIVYMDAKLHTPMYFFLGNLSLMDIISTTATLHKILISFITGDNTISFQACIAQMSIYELMAGADLFILTAMSYDRYVAICNPLQYPIIMRYKVCTLMAFFSWFLGVMDYVIVLLFFLRISCYRSNIIDHFFCDIVPLMKLFCSDTSAVQSVIFIVGIPVSLIPFLIIVTSYIFIITTILRIHSSTGRRKAFYTCSSHLTVVTLFYVTLFFVYLTPSSTDSFIFKQISSLLNAAAVPLLNPIIYSLKNEDVKSALKRQLHHWKVKRTLNSKG